MSNPINIQNMKISEGPPEFDNDVRETARKLECPLWAAHICCMFYDLHYKLDAINEKLGAY